MGRFWTSVVVLKLIHLFPRTCLRTVPWSIFENQISQKTLTERIPLRQKLKMNTYSYRVRLALSEYHFTLNFCQVVFEKLVYKVWSGYDTETSSGKQVYDWLILNFKAAILWKTQLWWLKLLLICLTTFWVTRPLPFLRHKLLFCSKRASNLFKDRFRVPNSRNLSKIWFLPRFRFFEKNYTKCSHDPLFWTVPNFRHK